MQHSLPLMHTSKWMNAHLGTTLNNSRVRSTCLVYDRPHTTDFIGNGTLDFVPFLSVMAALDFRQWIGGEAAINDYCHSLAVNGGKLLAGFLGTSVMDEDGSLTSHMVTSPQSL